MTFLWPVAPLLFLGLVCVYAGVLIERRHAAREHLSQRLNDWAG